MEMGEIELQQLRPCKNPDHGTKGQIGAEGDFPAGAASRGKERDNSDHRTDDRPGEERKKGSLPSEERTDAGKKLHIAEPHRLARQNHFGNFRPQGRIIREC